MRESRVNSFTFSNLVNFFRTPDKDVDGSGSSRRESSKPRQAGKDSERIETRDIEKRRRLTVKGDSGCEEQQLTQTDKKEFQQTKRDEIVKSGKTVENEYSLANRKDDTSHVSNANKSTKKDDSNNVSETKESTQNAELDHIGETINSHQKPESNQGCGEIIDSTEFNRIDETIGSTRKAESNRLAGGANESALKGKALQSTGKEKKINHCKIQINNEQSTQSKRILHSLNTEEQSGGLQTPPKDSINDAVNSSCGSATGLVQPIYAHSDPSLTGALDLSCSRIDSCELVSSHQGAENLLSKHENYALDSIHSKIEKKEIKPFRIHESQLEIKVEKDLGSWLLSKSRQRNPCDIESQSSGDGELKPPSNSLKSGSTAALPADDSERPTLSYSDKLPSRRHNWYGEVVFVDPSSNCGLLRLSQIEGFVVHSMFTASSVWPLLPGGTKLAASVLVGQFFKVNIRLMDSRSEIPYVATNVWPGQMELPPNIQNRLEFPIDSALRCAYEMFSPSLAQHATRSEGFVDQAYRVFCPVPSCGLVLTNVYMFWKHAVDSHLRTEVLGELSARYIGDDKYLCHFKFCPFVFDFSAVSEGVKSDMMLQHLKIDHFDLFSTRLERRTPIFCQEHNDFLNSFRYIDSWSTGAANSNVHAEESVLDTNMNSIDPSNSTISTKTGFVKHYFDERSGILILGSDRIPALFRGP